MMKDRIRVEMQTWPLRRIIYVSLVLAACFAGVQAIWDPGLTSLLLRFLGAFAISAVYLLLAKRYPAIDNIFFLSSVPVTIIIAIIGSGMIIYGLFAQDWEVFFLGFIPLLFVGAVQLWESVRSAR